MSTPVKERPILFSGPMVLALLAGRKTQTRRIVNPQPIKKDGAWYWSSPRYDNGDGVHYFHTVNITAPLEEAWALACHYGVPGERLWVRETWRGVDVDGGTFACTYAAGGDLLYDINRGARGWLPIMASAARRGCWMPAIFLPRELSRVQLEVTEVRVQRLQEISAEDARAEGAPVGEMLPARINGKPGQAMAFDPRVAFAWLWDSINLERGYQQMKGTFSWKSNPWVFAITFKRVA